MARFLDAAQDLLGRYGYEGTTVRDISANAEVNLGTLKHYWGSKRELFRDLMQRRLAPVRAATDARLAAVEASVPSKHRPDPADVLAALVEPAFLVGVSSGPERAFSNETTRSRFHLFFGRVLLDPAPEIVEDLNDMFVHTTKHFMRLMSRACPELTAAELDWRINCIYGAISFAQIYRERIGRFVGQEADVGDELASKWVMHFLTKGIAADAYVPFMAKQTASKRKSVAKKTSLPAHSAKKKQQ